MPIALRLGTNEADPGHQKAFAAVDFLAHGAPRPHDLGGDVLCELAAAVSDLARGARPRAVVRWGEGHASCELGLCRAGADVLVTAFTGGALPEVLVHERRVDGAALVARLSAALSGAESRTPAARDAELDRPRARSAPRLETDLEDVSGELAGAEAAALVELEGAPAFGAEPSAPEPFTVSVDPTGEVSVGIGADLVLRPAPEGWTAPAVLRADLFGLLFRGRVRITVGEHTRELAEVFVFLLAEQLVAQALDALEAWTGGRAFHRRLRTGGAICGVRVSPRGGASVTLGVARRAGDERAETWTFPAVDVGALAHGVVAFGRALARTLVRRDRAQATNLRLTAFRGLVRELGERLRELTRDDSKVNAAPESYRAFAAARRPARASTDAFGHARLRFTPRWLGTVPSIDLRSTFLCGDALVVGAARESCCIDRVSGEILWRRALARAVSVMTPLGLARLEPDGALHLHELGSGEVLWSTRLAPRAGGAASGAVVQAPGLPRMLIVSEGSRHLCAIDLHTGEVRWRHAARRGAAFRLRRAGKLIVVASGEPALTALDVLSGEVVWRFCDRLRFTGHVGVDGDSLFATSGEGALLGRGGARLHHLDPWSGAARWSRDLPASVTPVGPPLLAPDAVVVVAHGPRGTGLYGFDRRSGEARFERIASAAAASCMVVDDLVIVNSEAGELVGIDAGDGATRYRHVFSGGADGDRPRRLEPVLRSGALFVPQSEVHVVRPRDGALLGKVPTDLIPDLLRVDERCDVYVVEESGHLAAFGAAARLTLVQ